MRSESREAGAVQSRVQSLLPGCVYTNKKVDSFCFDETLFVVYRKGVPSYRQNAEISAFNVPRYIE
jgi:hypothetical protein